MNETQQGALVSLHYSGKAEGPTAPFGLDPGALRDASTTLLLAAPEYHAVRSIVLDNFWGGTPRPPKRQFFWAGFGEGRNRLLTIVSAPGITKIDLRRLGHQNSIWWHRFSSTFGDFHG